MISNQEDKPSSKHKVFLSYGHDPDSVELANRLYRSLEAAGYAPWMDKPPDGQGGIAFNQDWRERIYSEIRDRSHMIALLSSHSTRKPGVCREEIALAIGPLNTRIYTVLVQPAEEVTPPLIVSRRQWLDMSTWRAEMEKGTDKFDLWYQARFDEILRVLEGNANFSGDMEAIERWLQPNKQFSNRIEAEHGFVGREWLLAGIGESSLTYHQGGYGNDKYTSAAINKEEHPQIGAIERWAMSTDENQPILWLCAPPGWGKSAVTARLAHAGSSRVLAVHFCRYNEWLTRDAREVIRSISYQMSTQLPVYRNALLSLMRVRGGLPFADYSVADLFHTLIKEPLVGASLDGGRISEGRLLIVIDALDECIDENGHSELLDLLSKEFENLPKWIGLVITSRPESGVIERFKKFGVFQLEAFSQENQKDLSLSLREWLDKRINRKHLETDKANQVFERLMNACQGNFQYLQTLKEAIDRGIWRGDESHLPMGFADLYRQWFERQFSTAESFDTSARHLLEWMLTVREPLTKGLLEQLEPDIRRRKLTRTKLGSMLVEDGEERLHFFHKSLAEWFSDERQTGAQWIIDKRAGHTAIAATMAQQWGEDHRSDAGRFFCTWPEEARTYALRHFPAHLSLSQGLGSLRIADVLTDFDFALDRCEVGAAGHMIDDLLSRRNQPSSPVLNAWRQCMAVSGNLLRQASIGGTAHHVLIQIALERPEGDPIHQAALASTLRRPVNWTSLIREQGTIGPPGLALAIDLGALVAGDAQEFAGSASHVDVQSMDVHWPSRRLAVATLQSGIMLFDIDSGLRIEPEETLTGRLRQFDVQQCNCQHIRISPAGDRLVAILDIPNRYSPNNTGTTGNIAPSSQVLKVWSLSGAMPYPLLFSTELPTGGTCSLGFAADDSIQVENLTGEVVIIDTVGHLCEVQKKISLSETLTPASLPAPIKLSASSVDESIYAFACTDYSLWRYWPISGQCLRLEDPTVEPIGNEVINHNRKKQGIYGLAISADGQSTAAVGEDGRLRVWRGTKLSRALIAHAYRATRVCLSPDARQALTAGNDNKLNLWNLDASLIRDHENEVTALTNIKAVDGYARRIVSGDNHGLICVRDEAAMNPMPGMRWQAHKARIWDLVATHCGRWLVSAGDDGKVCIWNATSGKCIAEYFPEPRRKPACHALAISPDGRTLVVAAGALIEAWDLAELITCGQFLQPKWPRSSENLHKGKVRALCFLSNDLLVSAGNDSNAFVISVKDGTELSKLDHSSSHPQVTVTTRTMTQGLYSLARSTCGRFMACSGRGRDRAITIWSFADPVQPLLVNVLHGHLRGTHFLAFTADGENLWSGSWDQTLALWKWQSATEQRQLVRPVSQLSVALMGHESDRLFVGTAIGETYSLKLLEP